MPPDTLAVRTFGAEIFPLCVTNCSSYAPAHRKPQFVFGDIRPCTKTIVYTRFEVFRTFRCVFMSVYRVFARYELWVNAPRPATLDI